MVTVAWLGSMLICEFPAGDTRVRLAVKVSRDSKMLLLTIVTVTDAEFVVELNVSNIGEIAR